MKQLLLFSHSSNINTPFIFESHFPVKMKKQRVAYIPNAKDFLEEKERTSSIKSSVSLLEGWLKSIEVVDVNSTPADKSWWLERFDLIWVGGGMLSSLHKAMFESGFNKLLIELLDEGVLYVGSSAGSMICSPTLEVAAWYPGESEEGASDLNGFNLIPYDIFPHYEQAHKEVIEKNKTDTPIVLLPDNSAIGLQDGELRFYNQARLLL